MLLVDSLNSGDFYFNGHYLSEFDAYVGSRNGIETFSALPSLEIKTVKILGRDGEFVYDASYNPRTFTVPIVLNDLRKIRDISQWLSTKVPSDFYYDGDIVKIKCLLDGVVDITPFCYMGTIDLKFICHDPYYYAVNDVKYVITKNTVASTSTTQDTVNMNVVSISNVVINNNGNIPSYPLYKINGTGNITITVNGISFTVNSVSSYVYIDTQNFTVYKDSTNLISTLVGDFVMLNDGKNTITASSGCTSLEIQCKSRWI